MAKNKITVYFKLFSFCSVLFCTVISKVLQILNMKAASDITISDILSYIFKYSSEFFGIFAIVLAVCCTIYAHSYFGMKTAIKTSVVSLFCLTSGKFIMFLYNLIANELTSAVLIAGALTYAVEILFDALIIIVALIISLLFSKKRLSGKWESPDLHFSPIKASILTGIVFYAVKITDLTVFNVIPFFIQYDDPTLNEIKTIVSDYLYYFISFAVFALLCFLTYYLITRITGKLKLKKHYVKEKGKQLI